MLKAAAAAAQRATAGRAEATRRAYASDWADFVAACAGLGVSPEPSSSLVAIYLDQLARAGAKVATIRRRVAAINARLRAAGRPALSVRDEPLASVLRGIRREIGAPPIQARALELDHVRAVVGACPDTLAGARDRALVLLGFAGAFRRSELVGLCWSAEDGGAGHVEFVKEGVRVHLRRSKTNQTGEREEVAICRGTYAATCPVRALDEWSERLTAATGHIPSGPVFRAVDRHGRPGEEAMDGGSVARLLRRVVARAAAAAGASEAEVEAALQRVSGHSLRAGLVTTAFAAGLSAEDVMRQTRHRDVKTLLGYRRHATAFVANVSGRVGL